MALRPHPCATPMCGGVQFTPRKDPHCFECKVRRNDRLRRAPPKRQRNDDATWAAFYARRDELRREAFSKDPAQ